MNPEKITQRPESGVENKQHYTYQVQMLIDMFNEGKLPEVQSISVEPRYGYVASINYFDGERKIIYGHDPGFNAGSSELLAKDKGYTKFMLREIGVKCPDGDEFLLPWWADMLRQSERQIANNSIQTTEEADSYVRGSLEYPVYVKPVSGSQGSGVVKVYAGPELGEVFERYNEERVKVALVEESLEMPDYRLLLFDGEIVNAYERQPLSVVGDGNRDIEALLEQAVSRYSEQGRDIRLDDRMPQIVKFLGRTGLGMGDVPSCGQQVRLLDISNLSAGGLPVDVMETMHPHWTEVGRRIAKGFNLRICGVDLACTDITSSESDYSVIEVNATPGAKQFMASGDVGREKLEALFMHFFRTSH